MKTSWILAILGWLSFSIVSTIGFYSREDEIARCVSNSFKAYSFLVSVSRHLYTSPYEPPPICFRLRYWLTFTNYWLLVKLSELVLSFFDLFLLLRPYWFGTLRFAGHVIAAPDRPSGLLIRLNDCVFSFLF